MTTHPTTGLRPVAILVAIVALLALAVGGAVLVGSRPNPMEPSPTPIASPSAEPSPTPIASPSASSAPSAAELVLPNAGLMRITLSLPAGWQVRSAPDGVWVFSQGPYGLGVRKMIGFYVVDNLYADACNPALGWQSPPLGATAEDLVTALTDLPTYAEVSVTLTEVDGYPATHIERAGDSPTLTPECVAGLNQLTEQGSTASDSVVGQLALAQYRDVWIVDADGQRLLIVYYGASDLDEELDAIFASVGISP